jgi:hypothetical protein
MPTEALPETEARANASRRVLRLALGTSLSLAFSQAFAWDLSFIAPVFTLVLLSSPAPPPSLKNGIILVLALVLPVVLGGFLLVPFFLHLKSVAILLVGIALFHGFYLTARGGPAMIGSLLTIGITLIVAIGSVNAAALSAITQGLAVGAAAGLVFVWLAHGLLPDAPTARAAPDANSGSEQPSRENALRLALRAFFVVMPIATLFLFSPASASYVVVMIKVASMGQQSGTQETRNVGRSLIESTIWGGLGAVVMWQLLSIWPSLFFYALLMALAGLLYGKRIFCQAGGRADAEMWSYAFLTLVVLIAPAVLDSASGAAAGAAFWSRLMLICATALYGSLAVVVFDAFWPATADAGKAARRLPRPKAS